MRRAEGNLSAEGNKIERAFKAADLLLQRGGFGLVALDLADIAYTAGMTVGYQPNTSGPAGGVLTVGSANIALLGNYIASMFVASSDGHGGTNIVDPPPTLTAQNSILTQPVV